ncbi:hypothetical protein JW824_08980 [bacterium]|nr:hypothetical protein [bacterium]RQV94564.1 MAG: hypothetical protein EH221_07290 [bacterium]
MDKKKLELSQEQEKKLNNTIKNFRIALKNSVFYESNHPLYVSSIENFKNALDKWLLAEHELNLGITQDNLYLDGTLINEKEGTYSEIANYLHMRGIISLLFRQGITKGELTEFFNFIKNDRRTIKEKGGIQKNISTDGHLKIKEIDYSALLRSARESVESKDNVWQFLFDTAKESRSGELPKSKVEFLIDFLKDTSKSAMTLNKVYKEAVNQLQDEQAAEDIRNTIMQICQYFENKSSDQAREIKVKLMHVISQLHPDLIHTLFDKTVGDNQEFDLAESITKDFSESYIAEIIESLISKEDTFNENLLKVFDKLIPKVNKSDHVISLVADKLFNKRIVNPDTLSKLQMSIKEIFKRHPESNFMNQIYNITVDAVVNKKIDTLVYVARLTPLINKFVQSMEEGKLKKEEIWLLLNILWLENEAVEFKKFTEKVLHILPELVDTKDTERIKEIVEFFSEKTRPEQQKDRELIKEISNGFQKVTNKETLISLISMIQDAGRKDLEDITYILVKASNHSAKMLIDAFMDNTNPIFRNKLNFIFQKMKDTIAKEVIERFEYCEPHFIRDLFFILKECSPDKTHLIAKKLITHKHPQIRWEALNGFIPKTKEEIVDILKFCKKEKNNDVKKKAAAVILQTNSEESIHLLFKYARSGLFKHKFLMQLIELCGQLKVKTTFIHLKNIFLKRPLFSTKKRDELRVAAITSIARMHTEEAAELVNHGLLDKSKRVRKTSEIIMQLDQ